MACVRSDVFCDLRKLVREHMASVRALTQSFLQRACRKQARLNIVLQRRVCADACYVGRSAR
jgi:hypothetical protein